MSDAYTAPHPLTPAHDAAAFDCGDESLNVWLRRFALTNQAAGFSRTFVVTRTARIVGYYALSAASVTRADAPQRISHGAPDPIPVLLLARLGVDTTEQGTGLGRWLLKDAILRTLSVADQVGLRALLAHALDERAAAFYARYDFSPSPSDPLHMLLMLKDARKLVAGI